MVRQPERIHRAQKTRTFMATTLDPAMRLERPTMFSGIRSHTTATGLGTAGDGKLQHAGLKAERPGEKADIVFISRHVRFGSKADVTLLNFDVRYGSTADIVLGPRHVRFTSNSRHQNRLGLRLA